PSQLLSACTAWVPPFKVHASENSTVLADMSNMSYNADNMNDLATDLKEIGLNDHEARIYGALLSSSPASATSLAKKCALSRSSVYTTLSLLISKGLVGTTYKNEVKQFIAEDVNAL